MTRARRAAPTPAAAAAAISEHRKLAELEAWVAKKLSLRDLFCGLTTPEIRRDRLKVVLTERGLTRSDAGRMGGLSITWREVFRRLYGEDLA